MSTFGCQTGDTLVEVMRHRLTLVSVMALVAVLVPAVPTLGTSGRMSVSSDTTLTEDHLGGVDIVADDVTLDCAGNSVIGPGIDGRHGIDLGDVSGVTVKNCTVTGFVAGFDIYSSNGNRFIGNASSGNDAGFTLRFSSENVLQDNVVDGNQFAGFFVTDESSGNLLEGNTASNNDVGFQLAGLGVAGNTVRHNFATGNLDGYSAITSSPGTGNLYFDNACVGNTDDSTPSGLCGRFADDGSTLFEADTEWMAAEGITQGCGPALFCPDDLVTRGQMAAFVVRALGYTDNGGGNLFSDDNGSIFEDEIDKMATAGVAQGCAPDLFCPDAFVTRGQMAAFLSRALNLPDGAVNTFVDDDGSVFEADIAKIAEASITKGCTTDGTRFCPDDFVTRGQMAAFLRRGLE